MRTVLLLVNIIVLISLWSQVSIADTNYPTLKSKIINEIKYPLADSGSEELWLCRFQDKVPFATVNFEHPVSKRLENKFTAGPIFKSTFSYWEWKVPYGLGSEDWGKFKGEYAEAENDRKDAINKIVARTNFENFMKVLCGEHRDFPEMFKRKIEVILSRTPVVPAGEMKDHKGFDGGSDNIWQYFTGQAYTRLKNVTSTMYYYWLSKHPENSEMTINFNFTDPLNGHISQSGGNSNRANVSVKPISHCMMKFIFETYLADEKEVVGEEFDKGYEKYVKKCSEDDKDTFYNFRGHKNFQPLWLDSNGMIWNSRVAARRFANAKTNAEKKLAAEYYKRPFAHRYYATLSLWAGFLYYPEEHHEYFREASESGGGNQIYYHPSLFKSDVNDAGLPIYRLSEWRGEGDTGLESQSHPVNEVLKIEPTSHWYSGFSDALWSEADFGLLRLFSIEDEINGVCSADLTFAYRMQRLNQAIDRHTNWGPTMMVVPDLRVIYAAYSPLVACSYMIDASHSFATSDYPTTHPDEQGKTKWMYIMKFKGDRYYDENSLRAGRAPNWQLDFLNEAGLSNDYYQERALDHVATIPPENIDANLYLVEATDGGWL